MEFTILLIGIAIGWWMRFEHHHKKEEGNDEQK